MYSQNQDTFFVKPKSFQKSKRLGKRWYQQWWGILIIIFLTLILILVIALSLYVGKLVILLRSGEISPAQLFGSDSSLAPSTQFSDLAPTSSPSFGRRDAKVVIVEFGDFQCSACKKVQPVVKEILKDYGDKVLFIFRDFPAVADHPQALIAALAAECAHEQGGFWPMHDKIFEGPENITEAGLKNYAVQIGLSSVQFNTCFQTGKYLKEIENDLEEGIAAGVRSTPTFFINGVMVAGAIPLATFEKIIIFELSR